MRKLHEGITRRRVLQGFGAAGGAMMMGSSVLSARAQDSRTLTFLSGEDSKVTHAVWAQMFEEFLGTTKAISQVVPEYLSPDEALTRLSMLINTGQAPDVGKFDDVEMAQLAYHGLLEPITDVVDALGVPEGARLRYNGEDYFLPSDVGIPMLFYRKDWFDAANLQAPTKWDDYLKVAEALTDPAQQRYGDLLVTNPKSGYTTNVALNQCWSNGGLFFDWVDGKWQVAVEQHAKQLSDTIEWFKARTKFSPATANYAYAEVNQGFASGRVAMIEYPGSRTLNYLAAEFPDIEKVTGVSSVPANATPARKLSNGGLCIFKQEGRDPQAAKDLIKSMVEGPRYLEWMWTVPGHIVPTSQALFKGQWREHEIFKTHPDLLVAIDAGYPTGYSAVTGPVAAKGADLNAAASSVFTSGVYASLIADPILNGTSAEDTLAAIATKLQQAIDQLAAQ